MVDLSQDADTWFEDRSCRHRTGLISVLSTLNCDRSTSFFSCSDREALSLNNTTCTIDILMHFLPLELSVLQIIPYKKGLYMPGPFPEQWLCNSTLGLVHPEHV